jgi:O-antigen ligase
MLLGVLLLLLLIGLAIFIAGGQWEPVVDILFAQTGLDPDSNQINTLSGRVEIWSRAIYGIQDFPFTGMGMNNFRRIVPILYPLFTISPNVDIAHAHNHLLQAALDLGLPGLVAYLALWLALAALLWQSWRQTSSLWLRGLALGFAGSLLAYFVYGLLDAVALGAKPGFVFWFLAGLVVSLHGVVCQSVTAVVPQKK